MVFYYIFLSKSNFSALEVGSPTSQPATRPPSPLFLMIRRPSSCQGPCGVWSAAASRSQIVGRRRALPAKWISWILIPGGYMLSRSLCRGSRDRPLAIQLPEVCPVSDLVGPTNRGCEVCGQICVKAQMIGLGNMKPYDIHRWISNRS